MTNGARQEQRNGSINGHSNHHHRKSQSQPHYPCRRRQWVRTPFGRNYTYHRNDQSFILMSYNILAQSLLETHSYMYRQNCEQYLTWPHRLKCLQNEITAKSPAILCLQEVQHSNLGEITAALKHLNYEPPLYKKRSGEHDDGCAIFFNANMFTLIDHHFVEYFQPNVKILDRCNVAIIAKLACKQLPHVQFLVATTHLLFNPRREDVRMAQVQVLLAELDRLSYDSATNDSIPIILTGDLNFQQNSVPFRLIVEGRISLDNVLVAARNVENEKLLPLRLGIADNCQHLNVALHQNRNETKLFNSAAAKQNVHPENECKTDVTKANSNEVLLAYAHDDIQKSGQPFNTGMLWHHLNLMPTLISDNMASTFHRHWVIVDYIFYTKYKRQTNEQEPPQYSSLQLLGNLELPTIRDCHKMGPIPNRHIGSDHYLIAAEFVFLNRYHRRHTKNHLNSHRVK